MKTDYTLNYQIIQFEGQNTATFLQGQFTQDVQALTEQNFQLTAYCNPQGRMWCFGRLWRDEHSFYLLLPQDVVLDVMSDLNKYAAFSKVKITVNEEYQVFALSENPNSTHIKKWLPINAQTGLAIISQTIVNDFFVTLKKNPLTHQEWDLVEIRAGLPAVYKITSGKFLPHDINLPELEAVSFTKGCYKGQEIIARMHYRGQRKKHMYYGLCDNTAVIQPGDYVTNAEQKNVGNVVRATVNNAGQYELLIILPDTAIENHDTLFIHNISVKNLTLPGI